MANCCFFSMDLVFQNQADKKDCLSYLLDQQEDADSRGEGFSFGPGACYMFDTDIQDAGPNAISLDGWVRWGFDDGELSDFFEMALDKGWNVAMTCKYNDPSMIMYGELTFDYSTRVLSDMQVRESYLETFYENATEEEKDGDGWLDFIYDKAYDAPSKEWEVVYARQI